jgi:hypothetical protein
MQSHFIRTRTFLQGDEILLVSEDYINHLRPSGREMFVAAVGGSCAGSAPVWLFMIWSLGVTILAPLTLIALALVSLREFRRLRRERLSFLRSAEAKQIK